MGFQKFSRGGGSFRGRGGRGGGRFSNFDDGPPERVIEVGSLLHPCQEDLVCKLITENIPYSNAPVYLQNKEQIGKVDEIFGPIKDAFYMDPARFLTLDRVLNPGRGGSRGRGRGDFRGRGGNVTPGRGRGGEGRGDFRGRGNRDRGFRGSGNRGDFRGGRGNFGKSDSFRGRGGNRPFFGGKREFNGGFGSTPTVKKFKFEG